MVCFFAFSFVLPFRAIIRKSFGVGVDVSFVFLVIYMA